MNQFLKIVTKADPFWSHPLHVAICCRHCQTGSLQIWLKCEILHLPSATFWEGNLRELNFALEMQNYAQLSWSFCWHRGLQKIALSKCRILHMLVKIVISYRTLCRERGSQNFAQLFVGKMLHDRESCKVLHLLGTEFCLTVDIFPNVQDHTSQVQYFICMPNLQWFILAILVPDA